VPRAFGALVEELLDAGLQVRFRARGRSMAPAVRDGDVLTVAPVAPDLVTVGDVILCDTWRGPIAHRVVAIHGNGSARCLVLKGDCSLENDRPIQPERVRGRLVAVERNGHVDRHAFAGGGWTRRLHRVHARCEQALLRVRLAAAAVLGLA
jgi:hypothetical protein